MSCRYRRHAQWKRHLQQVEREMTRGPSALATNAWPIQAFFWLEWGCCGPNPARPGGPTAKRQPSPEGLGNRLKDPSAGGAALTRSSAPCVTRSNLTCLRQVEGEMNSVCEVVVTAITPNGSAALPFVIPSTSTCLRQVEGEMNDIHWDSWWDHQIQGERRPPLCHSEHLNLPAAS